MESTTRQERTIMARLNSQMDMEYVPSYKPTVAELAEIIDYETIPEKLVLFDPCAGEGEALKTLEDSIRQRWEDNKHRGFPKDGSTTYGVELDRNRARKARKLLDNLIQTDYFNALITDNAFNIVFLNPPYDYDADYKRLEHRFLVTTTRLMGFGTLLIFLVPRHELRVSAEFLSQNFSNFRVWQAEGNPDAEKYDQVILTATRDTHTYEGEKNMKDILNFVDGKVDSVGSRRERYSIRRATKDVERFTALRIDYDDVLDEVGRTGYEAKQEWTDWASPPMNEVVRPRMAPRMGHMGLIMAGGGVGGLGIPVTDGDEGIIFRATSNKVQVSTPQNDAGTVQVVSERMSNSAVLLDPSDWTFSDHVNLTDFVMKWRNPLATYLADVMPPKYSPAALRELLGGKPKFKRLLRPPMPGNGQRLAIEGTMYGLLANERGSTTVGEMGTGKTYISMSAVYLAGKRRVVVLCPPTLVWKWEDEVMKTIQGARIYVIGKRPTGAKAKQEFYRLASSPLKQLQWLHRYYSKNDPEVPVFIVMAHSTAKASYGRIPAVIWRWGYRPQAHYTETGGERIHANFEGFSEYVPGTEVDESGKRMLVKRFRQKMCCPECFAPIVDSKGEEGSWDWLAKGRRTCLNQVTDGRSEFQDQYGGKAYGTQTRTCGAPLWQALARNFVAPSGVQTGFPQHEAQLKSKMRRRYIYAASADADEARRLEGMGSRSRDFVPSPAASNEGYSREVLKTDKYPPRKYDLAEYIKKYLPDFAEVLIADEVHQFKAGDSAQGQMARMLAEVIPHRISLTGTLMAGYARDLFHLLYGFGGPEVRKDFAHNDATRWRNIHGFVEKTVYLESENADRSRVKRKKNKPKDLPGAMPSVLKYILGQSVFIRLKDVAAGLPPFTEHVITVPLDTKVDPEVGFTQEENYNELETAMLEEIKSLTYTNPRAAQQLVSIFSQAVLTYPDACTQENACVVYSPVDGEAIVDRPALSADRYYPKEEKLVEICRSEKEAGRKTLVFATHTNRRDLLPRLHSMLEENGLTTSVLRSDTVDPDKRMEWLQKELKTGLDVLICHPQLVETGVDMLEFPSIIWYEADYNTARVRQASRRSWRIGQTEPVRIYYLTYEKTKQTQAIYLIAQKVATSLAVEGDLSSDGLTSMAGGDNMGRSIAQMLVDGDSDFEGSFEAGINIAGFQEDSEGEQLLVDDEDEWDIEREAEEPDGLTDDVAWSLVSSVLLPVEDDGTTPTPTVPEDQVGMPLFDTLEVGADTLEICADCGEFILKDEQRIATTSTEVVSALDGRRTAKPRVLHVACYAKWKQEGKDKTDDAAATSEASTPAPDPTAYGAMTLDAWMSAFEVTTEDLERGKKKRSRRSKKAEAEQPSMFGMH